ncbi:MAG: hypothetical protein J6U92_00600 [Clostridia bacterium]|nr:hypothetical protein [Clostridia bacterium]
MFGYVKTDMPNLYVKDTILYKAMYCGLCKGIGKCCGSKGRLVLNYDLTFLSVLLHNLSGLDVKIEKQRCIIHHIVKRPVAIPDDLTKKIGALNVILAYHKLNDDVLDDKKGRIKRSFFNSSYKKAKKFQPNLDKIVKERYSQLIEYEKTHGDSIDASADPFGCMMQDVVRELLGDKVTEQVIELAYYLGKWIYLIDALDDFDKDKKKGSFNVFVNLYKDVLDKQTLVCDKESELIYVFGTIIDRIDGLSRDLKYNFNHDLTDNILRRGIKIQTKQIMENKKCKNTTKF